MGKGATLTIKNVRLRVDGKGIRNQYGVVTKDNSMGITGNTGSENVIIRNSHVILYGTRGVKNLASLAVYDSQLIMEGYYGEDYAAEGLAKFTMGTNMMSLNQTYYSSSSKTFLNSSNNSVARTVDVGTYININSTNFPDDNFRNYVLTQIDTDNDNKLNYREGWMPDFNLAKLGITTLKGLEYFPYVTNLDCSQNSLTELDVTIFPYLETLKCFGNQLTSLNLLNNPKLKSLQCNNNMLTKLNIRNNWSLETLNCGFNQLTIMDFSQNPLLKYISMQHNRIDAFMQETLESLRQTEDGLIFVSDNDDSTPDNVCTNAQAEIARQKGWRVSMRQTTESGDVSYELVITGDTITSGNANDLTVLAGITKNCASGYARYDFMNHTLHLSGVDIVNDEYNGEGIYYNQKRIYLTIMLGEEPVNITTSGYGIFLDCWNSGSLTITSEPSDVEMPRCQLNIVTSNLYPIGVYNPLIISGQAKVTAQCTQRSRDLIYYNCEGWTMTMKENAELTLKANQYASPIISGGEKPGELILEDGIAILSPAGATWNTNKLVDKNGKELVGVEVYFGKLKAYNFTIAGQQVTNANKNDVLGDGTVSFDGVKTLTLNNATITGDANTHGIEANMALNIKLVGENNVLGKTGINFKKNVPAVYITGPGKLTAQGLTGIYTAATKTYIGGGAQVFAEGASEYGIGRNTVNGKELVVNGEETLLKMKGKTGALYISTLTLEDGLEIVSPSGAYFFTPNIVDSRLSKPITNKWVKISKPATVPTAIESVGTASDNGPAYNLNGQRVGADFKGIVIEGGKKHLRK